MKKLLVLLLVLSLAIFAFTGCDSVVPSEGEGEGEGEGEEEVKQVVLVETFVADGCPKCALLKPILEELADEYDRDEMILVELIPWGTYSLPLAYERYSWYSLSGVPQTLFNGTSKVVGNAAYATLKSRIQAQLNLSPKVSIQASRSINGQTSIITGSIKNISGNDLSNLVINGMTLKSRGDFGYSVTKIFENEKVSISSLAAGETKSFTITLTDINWDGMAYDGVIFVQSSSAKSIYQALYID